MGLSYAIKEIVSFCRLSIMHERDKT